MIAKQYQRYITNLYLKNLLMIILIFMFLSFFLNIFEEIKYFENKNSETYIPILLTILNIPSILFEILPFIFLLGVMFFFISLYDRDEIELFKSNGINNFNITSIISIVSLILGILLIILYLKKYDVDEIFICLGYKGKLIEKYFFDYVKKNKLKFEFN